MDASQSPGVEHFVYTASNSVAMGSKRISGGHETLDRNRRRLGLG